MKRDYFIMGIFFVFILFSCFGKGNSNKATDSLQTSVAIVGIILKPNEKQYLNYECNISRHVMLYNKGKKDSLICFRISTSKPIHFYSTLIEQSKGKMLVKNKSLLVCPGDSIVLSDMGKVKYSTGIPDFVDDLIDIPAYAYSLPPFNGFPAKIPMVNIMDTIQYRYSSNEKKIEALPLDEKTKFFLQDFNLILKYEQLYKIRSLSTLTGYEVKLLDSINDNVINDENRINHINTGMTGFIMYNLMAISAKNKGERIDNQWIYFTKVKDNIKKSALYKYYMYKLVATSFEYNFNGKNNVQLPPVNRINDYLSIKDESDSMRNSLVKLTAILLKTQTNYLEAKKELKYFDHGQLYYLFASDAMANHEKKNLSLLKNAYIVDTTGKVKDFKDLFPVKAYKLMVVDFWASWCIPCLNEIPYLNQLSKEFQNQPVLFVAISIDQDADVKKWIAKSKLYNIKIQRNLYRLINYEKSPLTEYLQVNIIPRYILLNSNGEVINDNMAKPSDVEFKKSIIAALKN